MTGQPSWTRWLIPLSVVCVAAVVRLWGIATPRRSLLGRAVLRLRRRGLPRAGGSGNRSRGARREDRRRGHVGPPARWGSGSSRCWASAPSGDAADRVAAALGLVRHRGRRPAVPARAAAVAIGVVGGVRSLLLALDGLHIVQSRIAMLDIYLTHLRHGRDVVSGARPRADGRRPSADRWPRIERVGSVRRIGCGRECSWARPSATKWSGAFALAVGGRCCSVWFFTGGRRHAIDPLGPRSEP